MIVVILVTTGYGTGDPEPELLSLAELVQEVKREFDPMELKESEPEQTEYAWLNIPFDVKGKCQTLWLIRVLCGRFPSGFV